MDLLIPQAEDYKQWEDNIKVWIDGWGGCQLEYNEEYKCPLKKKNCAKCDYFMGHENQLDNNKMWNLKACCWAIKQLKLNQR